MGKKNYFSEEEISCNCGCGQEIVQPLFLHKMNELRSYVKFALIPTSWNRCPAWNEHEGGSDTSSHLIGWASDLSTPSRRKRDKIIYFAGVVRFRGIGVSAGYVHLDDDPDKSDMRYWRY